MRNLFGIVFLVVLSFFTVGCDKLFIEPDGVYFTNKEVTMMVGESIHLEYRWSGAPLPEVYHDRLLSWSSTDMQVATVYRGEVVARRVGQTVITAAPSNGGKYDECLVIVTKKE